MIEGNPVRALERGEQTELPSVLYIKAATDVALPRPHADRFICAYRRVVGGRLELQLYEGRVIRKLDLPVKAQAMARIIEFVHAELDW